MAMFHELWHARHTILKDLQQQQDDAKTYEKQEKQAANTIQRVYRGQFCRSTLMKKKASAMVIQRMYRGHLGRRCVLLKRRELAEKQHAAYVFRQAALIQKIIRGMISRRTNSDFYKRKAYIQSIVRKGEEMRQRLVENLSRQQLEEQQAMQAASEKEVVDITGQLHHLVSTKAIAGVYNSPMLPDIYTCQGVSVEAHIRTNARAIVKDQLRTRKSPSHLQPYPPSKKQTILSTAPYDAVAKAERESRKFDRYKRVTDKNFVAIHNPAQDAIKDRNKPGINAGVEYVDEWRNPYKRRGIPRSKTDLLPKLTTLEKAPDTPFYLTFGGNKSRVHANNRFDV